MFSSNHLPCSTNVFTPDSFFDHEETNLHFNNPFISSNFATHQQFSDGSGLQHYDQHQDQHQDQDQDQYDLLDSMISPNKKKTTTSMKDGHSKIHTAKGPRDRRVRMSIEISRKFFCLQDLLGYDKASKTLDWLFAKSLTAIKDLVKETNQCSSSVMTDQSRVKFLETMMGDSVEEGGPRKKKMTQRCKGGIQDGCSRYQLRVDARSRARERTKEKLLVKKFVDQESWKMYKDSSFLIGGFMGDPVVNDLDLE